MQRSHFIQRFQRRFGITVTDKWNSPFKDYITANIASYRFKKPVMTLYNATIPFFLILLVAVLIITYWP